jgi:tetratricopeptide (TPR) repeat protein
MADIYCEQGDYEMAIELYSRLLQYEPDNADAHTYVGYLHWQLGHIEEAEAAYRKAIHFNPNNALACNNLGVILLDEYQDPEGAKGLFEHALECQPDYALACFNIGRVHEMLGDVRQAAKAYSQALELNVLRPELDPLEITSRLDSLFKVS